MSRRVLLLCVLVGCLSGSVLADVPTGTIKGTATQHTQTSLQATMDYAWVTIPSSSDTNGVLFSGFLKDAPKDIKTTYPLVLFVHGSSGITSAIKEWQLWAAKTLGVATITPDSMQLPDRMTYVSPIPKLEYEKIHALRMQELQNAVTNLLQISWVDSKHIILAGTSEGAVSIARYTPKNSKMPKEIGRIIFSWSCEDNYMVKEDATQIPNTLPVLNVMSSTDRFFSQHNPYLGNQKAVGYCGNALASNKNALIVLLPSAEHTLFNTTQAHSVTQGFVKSLLAK